MTRLGDETMNHAAAHEAADTLWRLWSSGRTIGALPEHCRPATIDEGWRIQRALDGRAGRAAGWKIAATSKAGQDGIGVDGPLAGRLYARSVVPSSAQLDAGPMTMRLAEPEFAFRMERDLEPASGPISRERVLGAVGSLHPAIEVPDSRFDDYFAVGPPSFFADALCGGFAVVGDAIENWKAVDLPSVEVTMTCNGEPVSQGTGADVLGDPGLALVWLAAELDRRGEYLRAGDVVITGACTPAQPVAPGDRFVADFGGLGTVEVRFAPPGDDG